jgi:hypothetical protein
VKPPPCPICPPSGETVPVVYFVTTLDGLDCRCEICGTDWHVLFEPLITPDDRDRHPQPPTRDESE